VLDFFLLSGIILFVSISIPPKCLLVFCNSLLFKHLGGLLSRAFFLSLNLGYIYFYIFFKARHSLFVVFFIYCAIKVLNSRDIWYYSPSGCLLSKIILIFCDSCFILNGFWIKPSHPLSSIFFA